MRRIELNILGIVILSLIFSLINISTGGTFLVMSLTLYSLFYLAFGIAIFNGINFRKILKKESYNNISKKRIFGAIILGFSFSILILGFLFKLMIWPNGQSMISNGLKITLFISVIFIIYYFIKKPKNLKNNFIRIGVITLIGVIMLFVSTKKLIEIYYRNNPEFVEIYKKSIDNPNNQELYKKLQQKRTEMNK